MVMRVGFEPTPFLDNDDQTFELMSETSSQRVAIGHIFLEQGRPHLQATSHEHEIFINDYIPPLPVLRGGMLLTDGLHLRIKPSDPLLPDDRLLVEVERQTFTTAPPPHINDASESAIELGLMASRNSSSAAAVNESQGSSSAAPEAQTTTNLNEPNEPIQVALGASLPHRSSSAGATSIASSVSSSSTHPPSPSHPVSSYTFRYGEFVRASIFPLSSVAPSESSWDSSLTSDAGTMQSTDSRASGSQVEQDKYEANTSSGLAVSSIAGGAPSLVVTSVPTSVLDAASPSTSSSTDTSDTSVSTSVPTRPLAPNSMLRLRSGSGKAPLLSPVPVPSAVQASVLPTTTLFCTPRPTAIASPIVDPALQTNVRTDFLTSTTALSRVFSAWMDMRALSLPKSACQPSVSTPACRSISSLDIVLGRVREAWITSRTDILSNVGHSNGALPSSTPMRTGSQPSQQHTAINGPASDAYGRAADQGSFGHPDAESSLRLTPVVTATADCYDIRYNPNQTPDDT
ncbi:hypothetical protein CF335_g8997, partial [Tilletia laevis]